MKRSKVIIAVVLAVVLAVGALAGIRYLWMPHWRPSLAAGQTYGIDVSHYQGDINWPKVAGDGIDFAYIKATEGGDTVDDHFDANWHGARAAGVKVGAYHFFTLCRTGTDQAANLLEVVPVAEADLPTAVDLEFPNNCADRPPVATVQRELKDFLNAVEAATGQPVLLYVQDEFDAKYDITATFDGPQWKRSIMRHPAGDWQVWQCSDLASVDGIEDGVDLDVMRER